MTYFHQFSPYILMYQYKKNRSITFLKFMLDFRFILLNVINFFNESFPKKGIDRHVIFFGTYYFPKKDRSRNNQTSEIVARCVLC